MKSADLYAGHIEHWWDCPNFDLQKTVRQIQADALAEAALIASKFKTVQEAQLAIEFEAEKLEAQ